MIKIFYHCRNLALLSSIFAAKFEKGRKSKKGLLSLNL